VKTPVIVLACLLGSSALAADTPAKPDAAKNVVRYRNDRVTARVQGMEPDAFLAEIAKQSGAKLSGTIERGQPVNAEWTDIPLKEALEHVLREQNYTLTYGEDGTLRAIQLKGLRQEAAAAKPGDAPAGASDEDFKKTPQYALYKAFETPERVPVEGPVAKRLGKSESPWDLLTNTAIADDDPAVRRSAVESGMRAVEANEQLRQAITSTAAAMTDAQLAAWARATMYHRAEDFMRNVRRSTTLPDFRDRSGAVLRELRKIPFEGPVPVEGSGGKPAE
jgi:hypothetical protein